MSVTQLLLELIGGIGIGVLVFCLLTNKKLQGFDLFLIWWAGVLEGILLTTYYFI